MSKQLAQNLLALLDEVVAKYRIGQYIEAAFVEGRTLGDNERELLMDALVTEFSETGLFHNDEPSTRGLQLEELIDLLNAVQIKRDGGN